jgi:exodeoxyribonuclease-3
MRIATWNVNSLNVRLDRVGEWLAAARPDVVCMQETKLPDEMFPRLVFQTWGYDVVHHGHNQWNGVAIASKVGIDDVVEGFAAGIEPDGDARLITATCGGLRVTSVYAPNGRAVGHEHYHYKLGWYDRLRSHLDAVAAPDDAVAVMGDFNIAPRDEDVWDPVAFEGETHVTPPERERLAALIDWGLVDVFRELRPEPGLYSWWDYRAGKFHKGEGMRIDLVLGSRSVADRATFALIDRNARKGKLPSDHAPVVVDLGPAGR